QSRGDERMAQRLLKGKLKIFFSYTYHKDMTLNMLQSAYEMKLQGFDAKIGELSNDFNESLDYMNDNHTFDLDEALRMNPDFIVIEDMICDNPSTSRHKKRYQDILELLDAGINVYTCLLVENIEGLNDIIEEILEKPVKRVPDFLFDQADEVEFIDKSPHDMMNMYRLDQLNQLRQLAMKRCMNRLEMKQNYNSLLTDEHILVCLSASPTNSKVIRNAAYMAQALNAHLTALYVETNQTLSDEARAMLKDNIDLAREFTAHIETVKGDDIAYQISEFANKFHITKIVLGHSRQESMFPWKTNLVEQLIQMTPDLDIYIIPVHGYSYYKSKPIKHETQNITLSDTIKSILILVEVTLIGYLFHYLGFSEANIITVYLLGVLLTAMLTSARIYSLVISIASVFVFNFFFTTPQFSLAAYGSGYPMTFIIMFIAAYITSTLTVRVNQNAKNSAQTAYRTRIMLETNQLLQQENNIKGIINVINNQLSRLLKKDIILYPIIDDTIAQPVTCMLENKTCDFMNDEEMKVVQWVYRNHKQAGATTETFDNAKCLYLPISSNNKTYGIVGIRLFKEPLDSFDYSILLSLLGEAGLAFEIDYANKEKAKADLRAQNEQSHANLLRSISHDLRTPLTSISGNAGMLLTQEESLDATQKKQLYTDMYNDAMWLNSLVENLLSVSRIENGMMKLNLNAEVLDELIQEAIEHTKRKTFEHSIIYKPLDDIILVEADARLIIQVIFNLLDNAIKYTPKDSIIEVKVTPQDKYVIVDIMDNGLGIPDENKPHIFDMFYTGNQKVADSHRSLGLGLALCKSIINSHHGTITVLDNIPHGSIFRFTLPTKEVTLYEE
ncbi:MAG: DUF4118 domain-containing protein, partial [Erysipelotrichaceae bacterium]|nr:DUF4118 domain-containing protein [Erysipelotrichaceae bacterium]